MNVPDNATPADLGDEPEGFWDVYRAQIDVWVHEYQQSPSEELGYYSRQLRDKRGRWASMMTPRDILKNFQFGDQDSGQTQETIIQMKTATSTPALSESIKKEGVREPISVVTTSGSEKPYIEDGHHRVVLAMKYHPDTPIKIDYDFEGYQGE